MAGFDPIFQQRLYAALDAAEKATGGKRNIVEGYRPDTTQAQYRADYLGKPLTWKGITYQPNPAKLGRLAAPPGKSRHQIGQAADLGSGPVLEWVRAHAPQFGLETLRSQSDRGHIQLARGAGITGPVSSTVAGTTPETSTAAAASPANPLADALSHISFGGPPQSTGLRGGDSPPPNTNLQFLSANTPETSPPTTAAPDVGSLASLFTLPTIGTLGDPSLDPNAPALPGQAKPLKPKVWT